MVWLISFDTTIVGELWERMRIFAEWSDAQQWTDEQKEAGFLEFLEGVNIGVLRLVNDGTVFVDVRGWALIIGEQSVEITDRGVLSSASSLIAYIREKTGLAISGLELSSVSTEG